MEKERLDREIIAMRVAKELPDSAHVNLGIGIPTLVSNYVGKGRPSSTTAKAGFSTVVLLPKRGKRI